MDNTKSHVKVYNITPQMFQDFETEFRPMEGDLLTQLVPHQDNWGPLSWGIDLEEYDYESEAEIMHLTLETKWDSPIEWLQSASSDTHYFHNRLITMTTIQRDETVVTGVAVMDGDVLQNKKIWEMTSEEVGKYYNDDDLDHELDDLDNQIWDSITKFVNVCEQFYLEKEEEND
jgi:hypothetical protein